MLALALAALAAVQDADVRRYDVPLDALYDAAYRGAIALDLRVETTTKDGIEATYRGTSPKGSPFQIRLLRVTEGSTRADVAVENEPETAARLHAALATLTAD